MTTVREAAQSRELAKAADPAHAMAEAVTEGKVKAGDILRAVGIDPRNPTHQAALLAAERYGLDPLLKHIIVIPGGGIYITRDGLLHVAHRHGALDGIEVVETSSDAHEWKAKVSVYRKDWSRPCTYEGRYSKQGSNKKYGPEMAVKTAEAAALKRAFPVDIPGLVGTYEERGWDNDPTPDWAASAPEVEQPATPPEWDEGEPALIPAE